MRVFEILVAQLDIAGSIESNSRLAYSLPDEAEELLGPVLGPYGQSANFFFDKLGFGKPPAPWAHACLDREYSIAGHVATTRPKNAGVLFSPYTQVRNPPPAGFIPAVGVLTFSSKAGLEKASDKSPIFAAAWSALRNCSEESRWLAVLDPVDVTWLARVTPGDQALWLTRNL